jgi:hypothetical protein
VCHQRVERVHCQPTVRGEYRRVLDTRLLGILSHRAFDVRRDAAATESTIATTGATTVAATVTSATNDDVELLVIEFGFEQRVQGDVDFSDGVFRDVVARFLVRKHSQNISQNETSRKGEDHR